MAGLEIRLRAGNPRRTPPEELEGLAEALRREISDSQVTIVEVEPSTGYGVTAWEVLNIFVPWSDLPKDAFMAALGIIGKEAVVWARRKLARSPSPGQPKYIPIYGPDNEILRAIRVDGTGEEIDMTNEKREEAAMLKELAEQRLHPPDRKS